MTGRVIPSGRITPCGAPGIGRRPPCPRGSSSIFSRPGGPSPWPTPVGAGDPTREPAAARRRGGMAMMAREPEPLAPSPAEGTARQEVEALALAPLPKDQEAPLEERLTLSIGPHHPSTHGVLRAAVELEGEAAPLAERLARSVGPHHRSAHGVLRVVVELEGETVVKATPEIGFLHTGIEKNAEYLLWQQAITVLDRMDYLSPLSNNLGYVLAVEKLLGLEVPERARVVRVILAELQRIASHLVWLGTTALDLGAQSVYFYAFELREGILDLFEEASGARMNPSYFRVGGLAQDLPEDWEAMARAFLAKFPKRMAEFRALLDRNPIWIDRTKGIGVLTAQQAIALGLTGPLLRASGVNYDVRRA